ncbi:unnamed protein product, partial [Allacma fusca]
MVFHLCLPMTTPNLIGKSGLLPPSEKLALSFVLSL